MLGDSTSEEEPTAISREIELAFEAFSIAPPPKHDFPVPDSTNEILKNIDELLIQKYFRKLHKVDLDIQRKILALESLDVNIQIITIKTHECTHDFKRRIEELTNERERVLSSIENRSELSLIINDLDRRISSLETELDEKIRRFNGDKIDCQQKAEEIICHLDEDISFMLITTKELTAELEGLKQTSYRAQTALINQKYAPRVEQFRQDLKTYEQMQLSGWSIEHSDEKLAEILKKRGLTYTPTGRLLTETGQHISFQEAQEQGFFVDVSVSLHQIFEFFKEQDEQQKIVDQVGAPDTVDHSDEARSVDSKVSTEDNKYLKQYVGRPLALALAEIIAKQPKDPIHYLGHYLFKYRHNQELEEIQKRETEDLRKERQLLAQERWKRFVEEEARDAVVEMILRAENLAYRRELEEIAERQLLAAEEEEEEEEEREELLDEARDKFE